MLQSLKIVVKIRRIFVMVLLFTLCGMSLFAQKTDSIRNVIDNTELKPLAPGEKPVRSRRLQPGTEALQDILPDSLMPGEAVQDTIKIDDQAQVTADTKEVDIQDIEHSPRKALIYSIVFPGLGQAYNKKYWKIPIVYAAIGGAGYAIYYNTQQYRAALDEYALDIENTTAERYVKYWRRNLEISYIAVVAVDALAVVDAYVDANLFYWDVDPDLTLRMEPSIQPLLNHDGSMMNAYGFRASLTF